MKTAQKKLLEKVLRAVGLKTARSKRLVETLHFPNSDKTVVKTLRCIRIEDVAREDAEPVHFIDKDYGAMAFKFFDGASFFEDEDEIVEKLGEARELMWIENAKLMALGSITATSWCANWPNPFYGCKSLEEMAVKYDLLELEKS